MTESTTAPQPHDSDDLLWQQLKRVPAFRALLRSVEARFYHAVDFPQPILDVGCGDGHFAGVTFDHPITAGIDPWWNPLKKAQESQVYELPLQAMGNYLPYADHTFASAFSNSVLEHIPDIQPVLNEVGRVMQPGAPFVITVPSNYFSEFLGGAGFFDRLGLDGVGDSYRKAFNRISRHAHTDPPEIWAERLALAGFTIERWQYYFSKEALRTLELGHAQGVPSAVLHALTGHWILGPWKSNLRRTEQWVRPYYEEEFPQQGAYLFFLARKTADEPLPPALPLPHPYSLSELEPSDPLLKAENGQAPASTALPRTEAIEQPDETGTPAPFEEDDRETSSSQGSRLLVPGFLVALTLLFAYQGQSALRTAPQQPTDGIRWFAISAIALLLLLWFERSTSAAGRRSWHWPEISAVPARRWLYLPALLLAFFAYRLASSPDYLNPLVAIGLWVAAAALAGYALSREDDQAEQPAAQPHRDAQMFTIKICVLLFLAALLLRVYDLANHPFILNGTEASIGLEALDVLNGVRDNPFGTGWLTNPSLPFFLLAVPLRLFGASTETLRLLSALVGAVTVPVLFVIGQRLYGRAVGLVAAVLLTGSHFHIHFSRLGMTNVWDALLTLLALGTIAIAWQKRAGRNRGTWLTAGVAVGLSAYLYTSSHLLPIMLLLLGVILVILDRDTVKQQWREVLAMGALALVIALPQLLHYQGAPGIFMERANALGILDTQSGWLSEEAVRSGATQVQLLSEQFWKAALAFNATIDTGTSYGPMVPLLNFLFGLLAALGFILALFRLRQVSYSILVVWIVVTVLFGGALLQNPPNSHRFIIAAPALALLAAAALNKLVRAVTGQGSEQDFAAPAGAGRAAQAYLPILMLVAIAIAIYDVGFYFGTYRYEHSFGDRNTEIADGMAKYLNGLQGEWVAQFYGPPGMYVSFPTIPFLANGFQQGINLFDVPEAGAPVSGYETDSQVFFFLPERLGELEQLRASYPSGSEQSFSGYYADPLFYVYKVNNNP